MRRLAVKNSAKPQDVAAMASGARKLGPTARHVADHEAGGLADALADPADREEQDRGGDRDEDVVEAGEKPELLFVGDRSSSAGLRHARAARPRPRR